MPRLVALIATARRTLRNVEAEVSQLPARVVLERWIEQLEQARPALGERLAGPVDELLTKLRAHIPSESPPAPLPLSNDEASSLEQAIGELPTVPVDPALVAQAVRDSGGEVPEPPRSSPGRRRSKGGGE